MNMLKKILIVGGVSMGLCMYPMQNTIVYAENVANVTLGKSVSVSMDHYVFNTNKENIITFNLKWLAEDNGDDALVMHLILEGGEISGSSLPKGSYNASTGMIIVDTRYDSFTMTIKPNADVVKVSANMDYAGSADPDVMVSNNFSSVIPVLGTPIEVDKQEETYTSKDGEINDLKKQQKNIEKFPKTGENTSSILSIIGTTTLILGSTFKYFFKRK